MPVSTYEISGVTHVAPFRIGTESIWLGPSILVESESVPTANCTSASQFLRYGVVTQLSRRNAIQRLGSVTNVKSLI